jgi:2,4-dienoyl-CoA reductase (NADPH2)
VCAGQESLRDLYPETTARAAEQASGTTGTTGANDAKGPRYHLIGGAKVAAELDAKRAIREGAEVAAAL